MIALALLVVIAIAAMVGLGIVAIAAALLSSQVSQDIERRKEDL